MNETVLNTAAFSLPLKVKMVMIDLDGTLIDTAPDLASSVNAMLEKMGQSGHPLERIATWIGNGVSRLVKRALTGDMDAEPDETLFNEALAIFQEEYGKCVSKESRPYPGVVEGLKTMQGAGFSLACITNKAARFTLPLLHDLQLDTYFKLVLSGDSLPKRKPDPLPLLHACEYFAISPDHGVLVGDSINDTQAARAAGMPVICVPYGYNRGQDVSEFQPDAVVQSLTELTDCIKLYS